MLPQKERGLGSEAVSEAITGQPGADMPTVAPGWLRGQLEVVGSDVGVASGAGVGDGSDDDAGSTAGSGVDVGLETGVDAGVEVETGVEAST